MCLDRFRVRVIVAALFINGLAWWCINTASISAQTIDPTGTRVANHNQTFSAAEVAQHYVELAHFRYQDSLNASRTLLKVIGQFLKEPSERRLEDAKQAWIKAHCVYSHAEVFRFGNPNVDAWESKVNAWPMDEGLIDYVTSDYVYHEGNPHATRNIIQKETIPITDELISEYQSGADPKAAPVTSITDIESNVTTGFHAIEFLLWGQDQGTETGQTGSRPYTDFVEGEKGTNGFNRRRRNFLIAAARCLCADLQSMVIDWDPKGKLYASRFRKLPVKEQLNRIMLGMGSLCYAELAIERMRVALITSDQEEEQSCFSDTTLLSIHHNAISIESLYLGTHVGTDGTRLEGPSIANLVANSEPDLDKKMRLAFQESRRQTSELLSDYKQGKFFDWMIRAENELGRKKIKSLIHQLRVQATILEKIKTHVVEIASQE